MTSRTISVFSFVRDGLRRRFAKAGLFENADSRQLLDAMVFGVRPPFSSRLSRVFKNLGIYHLLVISGFHISVACIVFSRVVFLSFKILSLLFCLPKSSSKIFLLLSKSLEIIFATMLVLFVGAGAPAQRAGLAFVVGSVKTLAQRQVPNGLLLTAICQIILFTDSFFTVSNGFSWMAYLVVLAGHSRARQKNFWQKLLISLVMVLCLSLMASVWLGAFNPLAPLVNLFMMALSGPLILGLAISCLATMIGVCPFCGGETITSLLKMTDSIQGQALALGVESIKVSGLGVRLLCLILVVSWMLPSTKIRHLKRR